MTSADNPIRVVPGSGGVFKVTCGEHELLFQCPHHRGSINVPIHIQLRAADLGDSDLLDRSLRSAGAANEAVVVVVDHAAIDMADLAEAAARAKECAAVLVVRHDG